MIKKIVLGIVILFLSNCAVLEKLDNRVENWKVFYENQRQSYEILRDSYIIAREEVIKNWDKISDESKEKLEKADKLLIETDKKLREIDETLVRRYNDYLKASKAMKTAIEVLKVGFEGIVKNKLN